MGHDCCSVVNCKNTGYNNSHVKYYKFPTAQHKLVQRKKWIAAVKRVKTFTNAYMPVGFELAIELTFPSEEGTTAGILLACTQIAGVAFAVGLGFFNKVYGAFWSLSTQALMLLLGTIVTAYIPNIKLRLEAANRHNGKLHVPQN